MHQLCTWCLLSYALVSLPLTPFGMLTTGVFALWAQPPPPHLLLGWRIVSLRLTSLNCWQPLVVRPAQETLLNSVTRQEKELLPFTTFVTGLATTLLLLVMPRQFRTLPIKPMVQPLIAQWSPRTFSATCLNSVLSCLLSSKSSLRGPLMIPSLMNL